MNKTFKTGKGDNEVKIAITSKLDINDLELADYLSHLADKIRNESRLKSVWIFIAESPKIKEVQLDWIDSEGGIECRFDWFRLSLEDLNEAIKSDKPINFRGNLTYQWYTVYIADSKEALINKLS